MAPMSNSDTNSNGNHTPPPSSRSSAASAGSTTPTRPTNNYASINTPIASAKRPTTKKRTPVPSSATKGAGNSGGAPKTPIRTPKNDNNNNNNTTASKARYTNLSPMHNVKPVPRDSHHVPAQGSEEDGTTAATICCITATESSLSVVTEAPTVATTSTADTAESPTSHSASWVGRKVDALFSPVLSFLNGASGGEEEEGDGGGGEPLAADGGEGASSKADLTSFFAKETSDGDKNESEEEEEVQKMVREALLQAKTDLQKEEEYNSRTRTDTFDDIPGMTNTDSSGSNIVDADGDVAMADCYNHHQQRGGGGGVEDGEKVNADEIAEYLKVTLNDHDEEEEEDEEEYYDDEEDEEDEFNPYMFIKSLPPYEYALPPGWRSRPKALPPSDPNSHPICLVLDLDETLVHCTVEPVADADMVFPVEFNGMNYQVHVRCRPFLTEFLEAVSRKFEVVIFTASQQVYADKLLDKIDPEGKYIRHRMFRDSCLPVEGNYLKDLTILGRDLSKAVLVDNSPHAFGYQVDNGIPIESWFDDPKDKELLKLEKFLRTLHGAEDVRDVVRKTFQTHLLVRNA
mmetsp:Transcript_13076/g.22317  ORF Transcript_13076/g.22317 Transcript_13076/m.22317 type:complete len:573 (-) Transcript_13076:147-1865(-)